MPEGAVQPAPMMLVISWGESTLRREQPR